MGARKWSRFMGAPVSGACVMGIKAYFHYGCALRCVARDIETPIVFLFLSPRNATQRNAQP